MYERCTRSPDRLSGAPARDRHSRRAAARRPRAEGEGGVLRVGRRRGADDLAVGGREQDPLRRLELSRGAVHLRAVERRARESRQVGEARVRADHDRRLLDPLRGGVGRGVGDGLLKVSWRVRSWRLMCHTSEPFGASVMLARMWSPGRTVMLAIVDDGAGMISTRRSRTACRKPRRPARSRSGSACCRPWCTSRPCSRRRSRSRSRTTRPAPSCAAGARHGPVAGDRVELRAPLLRCPGCSRTSCCSGWRSREVPAWLCGLRDRERWRWRRLPRASHAASAKTDAIAIVRRRHLAMEHENHCLLDSAARGPLSAPM